jgi:arsenite methyltransferase
MSDQVREQVRQRYAAAAEAVTATGGNALAVVDANQCCVPVESAGTAEPAGSCCHSDTGVDPAFGAALYGADEQGALPAAAVAASLGCGNPTAVADLRAGERVLDLGSGGGIDVLLSAKRVGPTGFAYGVDMTEEMLALARANAAKAEARNVEFLKGTIENVPLPDAAVDVVISNCVINLSTDKPAVLAEMLRVLTPGGRIGISDVVAEDHLTPDMRAERGSYIGCIAGALSRSEYLDGLTAAGFGDAEVVFTHEVAPGMHGAIVHATKPAECCSAREQADCCEPSAKSTCCSSEHPSGSCACKSDAAGAASAPTVTSTSATASATIEVFEPALCCNTGICGEDVDQALVTFSADLDWAVARGGHLVRHNLANDPMAFAENDAVKQYLQLRGSAGLPLVLVNGITALTGTYPDRALLARWAGLPFESATESATEPVGESASGTVPAAILPRTAAPTGVQMLELAETGSCCSSDSTGASGCC